MKKNVCGCECTPKCIGMKMLVLGVLIILNTIYGWFSWGVFVGGIIGIKGLIMMAMPACPCSKK